MVHFKSWDYGVYVYVCVQLGIHSRLFPSSVWLSSTAPYIAFGPSAPGHSSTLPPCIYSTYVYFLTSFLSLAVSSRNPSSLPPVLKQEQWKWAS